MPGSSMDTLERELTAGNALNARLARDLHRCITERDAANVRAEKAEAALAGNKRSLKSWITEKFSKLRR